MNYREYLKTDYWRERTRIFKSKTHYRCYLCRSKDCELHVHHKRYKRKGKSVLFNEKHTDLRLLCKRCHFAVHKLGLMWHLDSCKVKRKVTLNLTIEDENRR